MIKLFRHIRKSLLEQNKMGKYFKYAIGEIILVVIGILIALQINNWNENRKEKAQVQTYYNQLLEELELDINAITFSIKRLENDIKQYKKISDALSVPNLPLDSILMVYQKADFIIENTSFNTKTIDVLLSTGDIKLINPKIKNALLALQNEQLDHIFDSNERFKFYTEMVGDLNFLFPLNKSLWDNQKELLNHLDVKEKMIEEIPNVNKSLNVRDSSNNADLIELNTILNLTQELIRFIKDEI
ncbi:DUF6090 family protein [Winogradskyella maritima]|uniref:DUF6090 family protein n=1 Tax=Winogradskyella maritima TaxID=1517766 RepID=A0ABV8AIE4_9FLAO|nr:DUF6090 family protein [Winogradskyella maritima]